MARIETYQQDIQLTEDDLIAGSNYVSPGVYTTKNYKLGDIAGFIGGSVATTALNIKNNSGVVKDGGLVALDLSASDITGTLAIGDGGTGQVTALASFTALKQNATATDTGVASFDSADFNVSSGAVTLATTSTAAELNILDGATLSTSELNILDGVTATTAELNILDGVTATDSELNLVDGATAGTVANSKAVIYGSSGEVNATTLQVAGSSITSSVAEINILDGVTASTAELNILDGVTSTTAELNILDGVTATATELNLLDGVTSTTAELNILDGVTSTATELNLLDGKAFLDEDNMASNSATGIASQQSIKAYVLSNPVNCLVGNQTITLSGDVTGSGATSIATTIAADAVHATMVNDDIISGQTELTSGNVVDADEMLISDGGTIKKVGMDSLKAYFPNTQTTYTPSWVDSSNDVLLRLTAGGAGSGTQDLKLVAGSNITLTPGAGADAGNMTITSQAFGTVYTVNSQANMISATSTGGDIVIRTDVSKTFIHNGGSAGDVNDFSELQFSGINSIDLTEGDGITLSRTGVGALTNTNNDLTITNSLATNSERGGVKIGYTTDAGNRNYAVQLSSEKMYVNVPWEANTFRTVEVDTDGNDSANETLGASETLRFKKGANITLAEAAGVITLSSTDTTYTTFVGSTSPGTAALVPARDSGSTTTKYLREDGDWVVPPDTDTNTFRTVKVDTNDDGTANETIGATEDLELVGGTNVTLAETGGKVTITATDTNTTYSAGAGIDLNTTTFSHTDTSNQGSVNNSGRTYIQDITLDTYGHVTALTSATETVVDTNTNELTKWTIRDDDDDDKLVEHGKFIKFESAVGTAGTNITGAGTTGDPWIMTITNPNDNTQLSKETVQDYVGEMFASNTETRIAVTYDDASNKVNFVVDDMNYTLPLAANGTRGGAQIGYSENGKNYPVELSSEKMFVNVPWTDTDNNSYINAASFNTSTGVLTLSGVGSAGATVDLDNRYLTSYSETDTLAIVTGRGASTATATNFTGSLTVNGTGAGAYLYVSGNAQSQAPPTSYDTGMAFVWNNSGGSRENEIYYATGSGASQSDNDDSYFSFINRFNASGTPTDTRTFKLFGDGRLVIKGNYQAHDGTNLIYNSGTTSYFVANKYTFMGNATNPANTAATFYDQSGQGPTISGLNVCFRTGSTPSQTGKLNSSGAFTVSGDVIAFGSPSDIRLKENIKPIESALDKVSKLQGVTFDWKEKQEDILDIKEDIGFIAQDVQKVVPELVRENEDGMLSMRHQGVAPILLEAIKELKAEIEELKKHKCDCKR